MEEEKNIKTDYRLIMEATLDEKSVAKKQQWNFFWRRSHIVCFYLCSFYQKKNIFLLEYILY